MSDHAALQPLLDVMTAAGSHDLAGVTVGTEAALAVLGRYRVHKSRPDILDAARLAEAGEWDGCWTRAYQAICGLTGPFPPDLSLCPARPTATPHVTDAVCVCTQVLPRGARFCPGCGTTC